MLSTVPLNSYAILRYLEKRLQWEANLISEGLYHHVHMQPECMVFGLQCLLQELYNFAPN
jgi:hypothetical protein